MTKLTDTQAAILRAAAEREGHNVLPLPGSLRGGAATKAEIDAMLDRLKNLSDDHFGYAPDDINWGHVGTLGHYAELLNRITDAAFKEGEHAE